MSGLPESGLLSMYYMLVVLWWWGGGGEGEADELAGQWKRRFVTNVGVLLVVNGYQFLFMRHGHCLI